MTSDGRLALEDALGLLEWLFRGRGLACRDAADVNDDGRLDLTDAIQLLGYLFRGEGPPPPPFPACGPDPTPDGLSCAGAGGC